MNRNKLLYQIVHLHKSPLFYASCYVLHAVLFKNTTHTFGARAGVVVKAVCYKPEGRGFDTEWGEFLNLSNTSGRIGPLGSLSL
jgi:hypothetical protein